MRRISIHILLLCALWADQLWAAQSPPPTTAAGAIAAEFSAELTADDLYLLATGHYRRNRWRQAADSFQEMLRRSPQDERAPQARFYAAEALMQLGEHAEAAAVLDQLLQSQAQLPQYPRALFRSGQAAWLLGDADSADAALRRFAAEYADHSLRGLCESYRAQIAAERKDWDAAGEHYRAALQTALPEETAAACRLGWARCLHETGRLDEAERFYGMILHSQRPGPANEARLQLGRLLFQQRRFDEAAETLQPLARSADHALAPQAAYWLGHSHRGRKQQTQAAAAFQRGAHADPSHPLASEMAYYAARCLHEAGDPARAEAMLQELQRRWPDSQFVAEAAADRVAWARDHRDPRLIELAHVMLRRWPQHPRAWAVRRELARELIPQQDAAQAVEVLRPATAGADNDPAATSYLLALAYQAHGDGDAAVQAAEAALAQAERPELEAPLRMILAAGHAGAGRRLEAMEAYRHLAEHALSPASRRFAAAQFLQEAVAARHWEPLPDWVRSGGDWLRDDQRFTAAVVMAADAAFAEARYDIAEPLYASAATGAEESRDAALAGWAWTLMRQGRTDQARLKFQELLTAYPDSRFADEARPALAGVLDHSSAQEPNDVINAYLQVVRRADSPRQACQALRRIAELLEQQHRWDEALEALALLEADYPAYPQLDAVLYQRAWILEALGESREMEQTWRRLIARSDGGAYRADACWRLAERAARQGDVPDALHWSREILRAADATAELRAHALMLAGRMAADSGGWDLAAEYWTMLTREFPDHRFAADAEFWLAESAFQARRYDEAIERFAQWRSEADEPVWRSRRTAAPLRIAQAMAHQRRWTDALEVLQEHYGDLWENAAGMEPDDPRTGWRAEALYLRGRCLASEGRFSEARDAYRGVLQTPAAAGSETAAKAQWMIGETFFHQRRYQDAITAYHLVELKFAHPAWQALALLQAGKCHRQLKQSELAEQLWRQVLRDFPETPAAVEAHQRLQAADPRHARLPKEQL